MKFQAISLFSGAGGDTLGMQKAGIDVVAFSEFDKYAILTHTKNFPKSKLIGKKNNCDITKIPDSEFYKYKGKIKIIFAGFPCQGFSHAGKKDINDKRNELFWQFVRVVNIVEPDYIIGENVKGLLERKNHHNKNFGNIINRAFEDIGYIMNDPLLLKMEEYGIPQLRRRVFFIGGKNKKVSVKLKKRKSIKSIKSIIEKSLFNSKKININDFPYLKKSYKNGELTYINVGNITEITGTPHPFLIRKLKSYEMSFKVRKSPTHSQVLDLNMPAKTIGCSYQFQPRQFILLKNNINNFFIRELTVNELKQIQSFPKNFIYDSKRNHSIKQIGNAVPPKMVTQLVKTILKNNE